MRFTQNPLELSSRLRDRSGEDRGAFSWLLSAALVLSLVSSAKAQDSPFIEDPSRFELREAFRGSTQATDHYGPDAEGIHTILYRQTFDRRTTLPGSWHKPPSINPYADSVDNIPRGYQTPHNGIRGTHPFWLGVVVDITDVPAGAVDKWGTPAFFAKLYRGLNTPPDQVKFDSRRSWYFSQWPESSAVSITALSGRWLIEINAGMTNEGDESVNRPSLRDSVPPPQPGATWFLADNAQGFPEANQVALKLAEEYIARCAALTPPGGRASGRGTEGIGGPLTTVIFGEVPWQQVITDIVAGGAVGLAAAGLASVLGGRTGSSGQQKPAEKKQNDEEEPDSNRVIRYILNPSTDRLVLTPGASAPLEVTTWAILADGQKRVANESEIGISSDATGGLEVVPREGRGQIRCQVRAAENAIAGGQELKVTATGDGLQPAEVRVLVELQPSMALEFF